MPSHCPLFKLKGKLDGYFDRVINVAVETDRLECPVDVGLVDGLLDVLADDNKPDYSLQK
jgi:hypothetical protein